MLEHDRYYRTMSEEARKNLPAYNFDHPDALDTDQLVADLDALIAGDSVEVPVYNFATHRREPYGDLVNCVPIILVDGILVLAHPALRERLDHKVFVATPDDVRLARRLRRDMAQRGRTAIEILDQYEATVRPMHKAWVEPTRIYADMLLDGTAPVETMVAGVLALIQQEVPAG